MNGWGGGLIACVIMHKLYIGVAITDSCFSWVIFNRSIAGVLNRRAVGQIQLADHSCLALCQL